MPDLERRPELRVLDRDSRERDVLLQDRAARPARDDADALTADVDLVAVAGGLVAFELEPDERALRVRVPLLERGASRRSRRPSCEIDGEADPGLEGIDLVVELVPGEDEPRLDAQHVERLEAERRQPCSSPASQIASQTAGPSPGWHQTS